MKAFFGVLFFLACLSFLFWMIDDASRAVDKFEYIRITVKPGQSLWSFAKKYMPGHDPRLVVDVMMLKNQLDDCTIYPYDSLLVPVRAIK